MFDTTISFPTRYEFTEVKNKSARYGPWHIEYNPKPIPDTRFDFDFWHEDFDGPEDNRAGSAETVEACVTEIHWLEEAE